MENSRDKINLAWRW